MFNKTKEFFNEYKSEILIIGGVAITIIGGVLIGKKILNKSSACKVIDTAINNSSKDKALLESYGAVFKDGYEVPFATKEIATKFMEERGRTYQIDILDDLTSVVWISQ